ncbi:MAG: amidohydrolase [Planctomycetota bacterium]|nr:amidohydrolase [Planctomycetota bacterium]MDA1212689.1 amidohydrolase [Planctomycetota bacterium]
MSADRLQKLWTSIEPWAATCDAAAARLADEQINIRRHLHAHPEPSGVEYETTQFILHRLQSAGIDARTCLNSEGKPVGVIAEILLDKPSEKAAASSVRTIALRADIDALRMPDQKQVSYASQHAGICHACGHDAHTAILLAAALVVQQCHDAESISCLPSAVRLRFLFQPAEETAEGAYWLIEQGAMEGVSAILGLHVDPERKAGTVGVRYGVLTAHCDEVKILIEGHGGHAARPHHTIDPVAAASHLIGTLHTFLPRSIDSRNPSVLTIGKIEGGYAPNVIPESVQLWGSLRSTQLQSQDQLKARIVSICEGVAQTTGATISVRFEQPLKGVYNHPRLAAALDFASQKILGPEFVQIIDLPSMGGEDFSVYLDHAPGAMLRLGCGANVEKPPFLHSPQFDIDEKALTVGTRILMTTAMLLACDKE